MKRITWKKRRSYGHMNQIRSSKKKKLNGVPSVGHASGKRHAWEDLDDVQNKKRE
jgi:hypothetical protein